MTRPRSQLVSLEATPYYHCISRCVRRAFLCGEDRYSGKSFDHRKPWFLARLALLTEVFAVDIAAYAIMSNHYHLVLHVDANRVEQWTDAEVIRRWALIYKGPILVQRQQAGEVLCAAEKAMVAECIKHFRKQLCNISRFMACLNEYLARKANLEDGCSGRFWEGRFKSQALLDEAALLSCMAYVDLNPVRAGIAKKLKSSDFTSIQARITRVVKPEPGKGTNRTRNSRLIPRLMPFSTGTASTQKEVSLPYLLPDYLELVDWTGKAIRNDKKAFIASEQPGLLQELGLSASQWKLLALDIQKESILILNGLEAVQVSEQRAAKLQAA